MESAASPATPRPASAGVSERSACETLNSSTVSEAVLSRCPQLRESLVQQSENPVASSCVDCPHHGGLAHALASLARGLASFEPGARLESPTLINSDECLRALNIPLSCTLAELKPTAAADWAPLVFLVIS